MVEYRQYIVVLLGLYCALCVCLYVCMYVCRYVWC